MAKWMVVKFSYDFIALPLNEWRKNSEGENQESERERESQNTHTHAYIQRHFIHVIVVVIARCCFYCCCCCWHKHGMCYAHCIISFISYSQWVSEYFTRQQQCRGTTSKFRCFYSYSNIHRHRHRHRRTQAYMSVTLYMYIYTQYMVLMRTAKICTSTQTSPHTQEARSKRARTSHCTHIQLTFGCSFARLLA